MKKIIGIVLGLSLAMTFSATQAQEEMKYLFQGKDGNMKVSGFAGVFNEFSEVDNDFGFSMGGGAALLLDRRFFLGAYGMGLTTRHLKRYSVYDYTLNTNIQTDDLYTRFGHGGLWLGYIHKPQNAINWGVNMKIGWGAVTLSEQEYYVNAPDYNYNGWDRYDKDNVFVFTPEANLNLNLLKWMRVNVGLGYRLVTGVNNTYGEAVGGSSTNDVVQKTYFDSNAFNSVTGSITLAFGWFGK